MCGIAGIIDWRGASDLGELSRRVEAMTDALRQRGPDDAGIWSDMRGETGVVLGHRRLSIIDLSRAGHQPMISANGRLAITYNGEIYNFPEIRDELRASGVQLRGRSDTEVLLEACATWGVEAALERCVGMFAFALWSVEDQTLTLARDRIGEKPLYWYQGDGRIWFASELTALLGGDNCPRTASRDAIFQYLEKGYVPAPLSIVENIHKLEPGTMLVFKGEAPPRRHTYWDIAKCVEFGHVNPLDSDDSEISSELERLLRRSVRQKLVSDVPLGVFLSGGVDVIFHLASRAYGVGYAKGHHTELLQHNERITNNLLEAVARHRPVQVLITSSSCVYDDGGPDTVPELPLFEGEPEMANWGYGWAKRFLEQKALIYARETGVPMTIVRPFNIYGERYNWIGEYSQAIPMLVKKVMDGDDPVVVWGSGAQRRNYMHAIDCARIMRALVEAGHGDGPVNIGGADTVAMKDLVAMICDAAGRRPEVVCDTTKPEGRFVKSSDATALHAALPGHQLEVGLGEGLARMTGWYERRFGDAKGASGLR